MNKRIISIPNCQQLFGPSKLKLSQWSTISHKTLSQFVPNTNNNLLNLLKARPFTHKGQWVTNDAIFKRNMWSWLNPVWNKYDKERVKEVGPDQAAAEWLLRCGASVKFIGHNKWDRDYNTIVKHTPSVGYANSDEENKGKKQAQSSPPNCIQAIDTNESGVSDAGFEYLDGLDALQDISLRFSPYVTDRCLELIAKYCAKSLNHLTIQDCYEISEWGLLNHLPALKNLKSLTLKNLPAIRDKKDVTKIKLKEILPAGCEITL